MPFLFIKCCLALVILPSLVFEQKLNTTEFLSPCNGKQNFHPRSVLGTVREASDDTCSEAIVGKDCKRRSLELGGCRIEGGRQGVVVKEERRKELVEEEKGSGLTKERIEGNCKKDIPFGCSLGFFPILGQRSSWVA